MLSIDPETKALTGVLNLYTGVKKYDSGFTPRIPGMELPYFFGLKI